MSTTDSAVYRLLSSIERLGNRLPHPTLLFIYLCGLMLILSALCHWLAVSAIHPVSGELLQAGNLLSRQGLAYILTSGVSNFTQFAPVGTVLVAIMAIGVAEHSGLLGVVLRATVLKAPPRLLTFAVVLAGVLSSLAADAGYVVLIPLAAIAFSSVGRSPIAGIAAAFAGVSGGYSANLLIGPLDAILSGLSTEAAQLVAPNYQVSAAANYYFILASTLLVAVVGSWVTERLVEPRLSGGAGDTALAAGAGLESITVSERRGLKVVAWFSLVFIALLLWGLLPGDGVLRAADGSVLRSPFIQGIVLLISIYAAISGWLYGRFSGSFSSSQQLIEGMEKSMATMASYLVLMFFAAQFVNYFAWSQLGIISAIEGAQWLQQLDLSTPLLLVSFVLLAALLNLVIGSASAKWALMAPVFVPMLLLVGISPEATQMAYRIGDSTTNIITPLMPYFGVVVAFVQRYDRSAGIGTIIATMLPYSLALLVAWSGLLMLWILLELPLGPEAAIFVSL